MSLLMRACLLLMMTTLLVEGGMFTIMRLTYHDPFVPYAALMPGQSIDALKDYPCRFRVTKLERVQIGYCQFEPAYGVFSEIALNVTNHIITMFTSFDISAGVLRLGDVILCWGKPVQIVNSFPNEQLALDLYWSNQSMVTLYPTQYSERFDDFLPINYLSMGSEAKMCGSIE